MIVTVRRVQIAELAVRNAHKLQSSPVKEATAAALGFTTHADLLYLLSVRGGAILRDANPIAFAARLAELGEAPSGVQATFAAAVARLEETAVADCRWTVRSDPRQSDLEDVIAVSVAFSGVVSAPRQAHGIPRRRGRQSRMAAPPNAAAFSVA